MWLKALHLIAMVTWFSGLFYLPRLFVYHALSDDTVSRERFKIMERRLYWGITTPGMVLTLIFGVWMLLDHAWASYGHGGWLHIKLALLIGLVLYHIQCGRWLMAFQEDRNRRGHVYYRWMNEIPVLFLVGIVLLAVLKPF